MPTASRARATTKTAKGDVKAREIIVIDDSDDENVALVINARAAAQSKRSVRVKAEPGVDEVVDILGGISLNGQTLPRVKTEPIDVSTPVKDSVVEKVNNRKVDITYTIPFPTPAPNARPLKQTLNDQPPLFLHDASDAESDWAPTIAKKGKTTRRLIRDPDSESDDDQQRPPAGSSTHVPPSPSSPISIASSPPSLRPQKSRPGPSSRPKFAANKYFDLEARGNRARSESDSEEDDDERQKQWRVKHYDESLGSLRDFIVDDDYESEEEEEESEEDVESSESEDNRTSRRRGKESPEPKSVKGRNIPIIKKEPSTTSYPIPPKKQNQEVIEIIDSDSSIIHSDPNNDDDSQSDVEALLHFSPPPSKLHSLPELDLATLTLHADSDSEPSTPPPPKRTSATRKIVVQLPKTPGSKKQWSLDRARIAQQIFDELDRKVFDSKLGRKGAGTKLEWNNRLLTTAGQAHSKRTRNPDGSKSEEVRIILSEKVLTGEEQIRSTIAHEMCHVASWVINDERKNPHGAVFKTWGRKVMKARPDIEVTTKHDYQIEYKYQWRCTGLDCDKIYKRHSKSIDIEKQACGRCRGRLSPLFETKKETAFQVYLRQNLSVAKSAMPGSTHGEVMRSLSRQWAEAGPEADHQAYWRTMATAARS